MLHLRSFENKIGVLSLLMPLFRGQIFNEIGLKFSPLNNSVFSSQLVICYQVHVLEKSDRMLGS